MFLRIEQIPERTFIGKSLEMSSSNDRSPELWRSFMPNRKSINRLPGNEVYSVQLFRTLPDFQSGVNDELYMNWAVVPVEPGSTIPEGMSQLIIPGGTYAVFLHEGSAAEFSRTAGFIYVEWLPSSNYTVINRPFFQVILPGYRPDDQQAEEVLYVPVQPKYI